MLRSKDETVLVFVTFTKQIQVTIDDKFKIIGSDNGTEFESAKFDKFYAENGINHNFSSQDS